MKLRERLPSVSVLAALGGLVVAVAAFVAWFRGLAVVGLLLLGVLACVVVGYTAWRLPRAQAARWKSRGVEDPTELANLENASRATVLQATGGFALVGTLALTAYQVNETRRSSENNLRLSEKGQVAERFAKAVEQLGARNSDGSVATEIRTGALFSLLSIGLDSDRDSRSAVLVVASCLSSAYPLEVALGHGSVSHYA